MIKILIVDDNKSRIEKLKSSLTELITKNMIRIDEKYTSDAAKIALKLNQYDYLILDVFLPLELSNQVQRFFEVNFIRCFPT